MRQFPYWTIGRIINVIQEEGLTTFNRMSYRNMEKRGVIPTLHRTVGKWRIAKNEQEVLTIISKIWSNFFGQDEANKLYDRLKTRFSIGGN